MPYFLNQNPRTNYFTVFTNNPIAIGTYIIKITATLDNVQALSSTANSYLDPTQKIDALNPPSGFIYTNSFLLTVSIVTSLNPTLVNGNYPPLFAPAPSDLQIYVGDGFSHTYGKALSS